jgi:hypothetical protein
MLPKVKTFRDFGGGGGHGFMGCVFVRLVGPVASLPLGVVSSSEEYESLMSVNSLVFNISTHFYAWDCFCLFLRLESFRWCNCHHLGV